MYKKHKIKPNINYAQMEKTLLKVPFNKTIPQTSDISDWHSGNNQSGNNPAKTLKTKEQ